MKDFAFKVKLVAVVRVRADDGEHCTQGRSHGRWSARPR
jgi:hypothetical protein